MRHRTIQLTPFALTRNERGRYMRVNKISLIAIPTRIAVSLVSLSVTLAACSDAGTPDFPMTANPTHASMFGEADIELRGDFVHLGAIENVKVNGTFALN